MNEDLIGASVSVGETHESSAGEEKPVDALEEAQNNPEIRKLLDTEQLKELHEVFQMFDIDESGAIDVKELK